jgi:hypothetical protein
MSKIGFLSTGFLLKSSATYLMKLAANYRIVIFHALVRYQLTKNINSSAEKRLKVQAWLSISP